jgi:hypothetical protein
MVGAHAAHRVMLGGAHRNRVFRRIDAEEVAADVLHFAQVLVDVRGAQIADVQPQMFAIGRLAAPLPARMCSAMRRDTTSREASSFLSGS